MKLVSDEFTRTLQVIMQLSEEDLFISAAALGLTAAKPASWNDSLYLCS
jgi:hypothetical protein